MAHRPILPPGEEYWEERKDIFRRLRNLERCAQLGSSSIREGALRILDETGAEIARFGQMPNGTYGLRILDEGGGRRAEIGSAGWIDPRIVGVTRDPAAVKAVTAGTWTQTWQVVIPLVIGMGVEVMIPWATDAATTGEVRVRAGAAATQAYSLAAGSGGTLYPKWLHDQTLGSGPMSLLVEMRRTGGINNVWAYQPAGWLRDPADCTASGVL